MGLLEKYIVIFVKYQNIVKDGVYAIKIEEHKSARTHWIAFYINGDVATQFENFGTEYIPKKLKNLMIIKIS